MDPADLTPSHRFAFGKFANGLAALALGAYILITVARGHGKELFDLIKGELGFIKWGAAVMILVYIAQRPDIHELGASLLTIATLGLAIKVANDPTILSSIAQTWNALPNASTTTKG